MLQLFTLDKRFQVDLTSCLQETLADDGLLQQERSKLDGTCTLFFIWSLTILTPRALRVGCIVMRRSRACVQVLLDDWVEKAIGSLAESIAHFHEKGETRVNLKESKSSYINCFTRRISFEYKSLNHREIST